MRLEETWRLAAAGCAIILLPAFGMVYAARAGLAQTIYHRTKFGPKAETLTPSEVRSRCANAHQLYPHNYYFSIYTAEKAWYERMDAAGREDPDCLSIAREWCDTGLAQNGYRSQLRLLKARLLMKESPTRAMDYLGEYVDWNFWEPYNHAVLAELHIEAGDYGNAVKAMRWVEGTRHYGETRRKLDEAWKKELAAVPPR